MPAMSKPVTSVGTAPKRAISSDHHAVYETRSSSKLLARGKMHMFKLIRQ
jgi:hypothetical protein